LGETLCKIYYELNRIPVKTIRLFNVYGPGTKVDDYRVIPSFVAAALAGKSLRVHGSGRQTRTFCYVADAVSAIFKVLVKGEANEVYNIGTDKEEISMLDLAKLIQALSPISAEVKRITYPRSYPAGEASRRCPDITKIRRELGYSPEIDLRAGLAKTIAWYQDMLGSKQASRQSGISK
jgi:UDP-glucuronate decarboxylase